MTKIVRYIQSDVVGEHRVELSQITNGYIISISNIKEVEKQWTINSSVVNTKTISENWYEYVIREFEQHVKNGITGIPSVLKNFTSGEVQSTLAFLLNRV